MPGLTLKGITDGELTRKLVGSPFLRLRRNIMLCGECRYCVLLRGEDDKPMRYECHLKPPDALTTKLYHTNHAIFPRVLPDQEACGEFKSIPPVVE